MIEYEQFSWSKGGLAISTKQLAPINRRQPLSSELATLPGTVQVHDRWGVCQAIETQIDCGGEEPCQELQTIDVGDIHVDLAIKEKVDDFVTQLFEDDTSRRESSRLCDWRKLSAKVFPVCDCAAAINAVSKNSIEKIYAMFCVESHEAAAMRRSKAEKKIADGQVGDTVARAGTKQFSLSSGTYFGEVFGSVRKAQIAGFFCVESPEAATIRRSESGQGSGDVASCQSQVKVEEDIDAKKTKRNIVLRFYQSFKRALTGK